jgi:tRNA (guanine37-N1)-methyltransferase
MTPLLEFHFLTLFPGVFPPVLSASLMGKAAEKGLLSFHVHNIRDHAKDKHRTVDEPPYGGGEGMLLKVDVLHAAWRSVVDAQESEGSSSQTKRTRTILLSPQGPLLTADKAKELAQEERLVFVCGHYEGVDERFIELCVDEELSIGDYVLTGGELPAMVVADAVARWVPGVVGKEGSVSKDSLEGGLLKYPQYTRPAEFEALGVPAVLTSGNHGAVEKWRAEQAQERTRLKRPDLYAAWAEANQGKDGGNKAEGKRKKEK